MTAQDAASSLGTRPVGRLLWENCAQTTASVGLYGVYALTNAWFVARGAGPDAVAAVNLAAPLLLVIGAVSTTVGAGGGSLVSRARGAGDHGAAARAAGNAFVLFWSVAAASTLAGLLALDPLLSLLGVRGGTREPAHAYAQVLLAGALVRTARLALTLIAPGLAFAGITPADDPRMLATIHAVAERLTDDRGPARLPHANQETGTAVSRPAAGRSRGPAGSRRRRRVRCRRACARPTARG